MAKVNKFLLKSVNLKAKKGSITGSINQYLHELRQLRSRVKCFGILLGIFLAANLIMAPISKTGSIIVTHYTNPQLFWFKYKNDVRAEEFLAKLEKNIARHMKELQPSYSHSPRIGEIVLVRYSLDTSEHKWIRARVDLELKYNNGVKYVLWSVDYGFPLQSECRWIRQLLFDELKIIHEQFIFKGGLYKIVPATAEFNFDRNDVDVVKTKKWSPIAIQFVEKLIYEADTLIFRCSAYLDDHFFGTLIVVSHGGKEKDVLLDLRNRQECKDSRDFVKEFKSLEHQPYWEFQDHGTKYPIKRNNTNVSLVIQDDDKSAKCGTKCDENNNGNLFKRQHCESKETDEISVMTSLNLSDNFKAATNLSSHKINLTSTKTSSTPKINSTTSMNKQRELTQFHQKITSSVENKQTVVPAVVPLRPIIMVPMNRRLVIAQQQFEQKERAKLNMKDEGKIEGKIANKKLTLIDQLDKEMMLLSLPAGYLVSSNLIDKNSPSYHQAFRKKDQPINHETEPWSPQIKIIPNKLVDDENARPTDEKSMWCSTKKLSNTESHFTKALNDECFTTHHSRHILVHDQQNLPKSTIQSVAEANFSPEIFSNFRAALTKTYNQIYRIQTIGWPRIMWGGSFIVVNSAKTGKTWTYLPAICSKIIELRQDNKIVGGNGPMAIIICTSSSEVEKITKYTKQLLQNTEILCMEAYGFYDQRKVLSLLLNGVEILVTTIPCFHRLLKNELKLFNKERIISVVFDKIDLMYELFTGELHDIFNCFCINCNDNMQTVVTSRTWHKVLELFYRELKGVTLCIGAHIEASIYARTEMSLELIEHISKEDRVISYLSDERYKLELTLIICNESMEVEMLMKKIRPLSIPVLYCHEKSDSCDILRIKEFIEESSSGTLLICTDDVLFDLDIRHAPHVIHFSLPSTWSLFSFRYSASLDYYENMILKKNQNKPPATSLVFLDEHNNEQLPRLIDFMKIRGGTDIPEKIMKFSEKKRIENEERRADLYKPFCNTTLTNGICYDQSNCQERHVLTKFDRSSDIVPRTGTVKFEIITIHTPVHFTVRLLEHKSLNETNWLPIESANDYISFNMEFSKYFNDHDNHVIHSPCTLGDLCVVATTDSMYQRCKIVKIEKVKSPMSWNSIVDVLLIDSNAIAHCHSTELMELPQRFQTFPPQAVDVRIGGVAPHDLDCCWDSKILDHVKKWLTPEKKSYTKGNIQLSLMNTLWVDSVDIIETLHSINQDIKSVSIKSKLLSNNFGVRDSKAVEFMKNLAEKADILDVQTFYQPHPEFAFEANFETDQIADVGSACFPLFHNSGASSLCDSELSPSDLNWSTTTDDDEYIHDDELELNVSSISISSTKSEQLLVESNDKWSELMPNQFNKVYLSAFYHPRRFYIRNNDRSSRTSLTELHERIDKYMETSENIKPLVGAKIADNCLAELRGKFRRAKILKIFEAADKNQITVEVFFVDFGESYILPLDDLIEMPSQFIKKLPFQTIFCKMIGIRPLNESPKWSDLVCDEIYDILDRSSYLFAYCMQNGEPDKFTYGLKSHSYEIVFVDQSTDNNINRQLLVNNLAEHDPITMHFIDVIIEKESLRLMDYDSDDESENSLVSDELEKMVVYMNFTDDDVRQLLQSTGHLHQMIDRLAIANNRREGSSLSQIPEEKVEENVSVDEKHLVENDNIESELLQNLKKFDGLTNLIQSHLNPNIKWHQTNALVTLTISAPDVSDYYLKVTSRFVHICFEKDRETFSALLNLFGCIDIIYTSHEVRGLNVVVRLVKALNGPLWPRLLQNNEKYRWLKYNSDAISEKFKEVDLHEDLNDVATPIDDSTSESRDNLDFQSE